jgi:tetratricopeptide (TPR) repeat protein
MRVGTASPSNSRRAQVICAVSIAVAGLILVISLAELVMAQQSHRVTMGPGNSVYVTLANSRFKHSETATAPPQAPAQVSNSTNGTTIIEWSGFVIASFTLLITILTLGTAVAALYGFSELRRARDRATTAQKQMANRLTEIEDLADRWEKAVQDADTRVETIVQSAYGFNQGQEAYADGNYQRAVDCFRRANQLQSRSTAILYKLGRSYTNIGELERAESAFNAALEIEPSCAEAYRGIAIAYRYDDLPKALINAQAAVEADPEDLKNWNCLGLLLRDDGKNAEAITAHQHAYRLDETQRITAFYLALLYADTKRTASTGEFIHQATANLELDQHYGRIKPLWAAVLNWAHAVFDSNDEAAADWARKAAAGCQSGRRIHEVRGHMLFLLTALGRAGLIEQLPETLRSPVTHPRPGARYDHSEGATAGRQDSSTASHGTDSEERRS